MLAERFLRSGIYFLVVAVPLAIVSKDWLYLEAEIGYAELPKTLILRLTTLALLPVIVYIFFRRPFTFNWLALPVAAFLVWSVVATAFSTNPRISFWGEFPGQDSYSFLATFHYSVLFLAVVAGFRTSEQTRTLLAWIAVSGTLASVPILLQYLGAFPFDLIPSGVGRPTGTFANPVFAGSFICLTLATTLYVAHTRLWFWANIAGIQLMALLAIQSRAGLLGVLVILVWLGVRQIRERDPQHGVLIAGATIGLVLLTIIAVPRITTIADMSGRLAIWRTSGEIIADNPAVGVGPDMFRYAHLERAPGGPTGLVEEPDHAHNWITHHSAEMGLPGGLAAAALLLAPLASPLAPVFAARATEQMFGVARVSDLMLMFILLGEAHNAKTQPATKHGDRGRGYTGPRLRCLLHLPFFRLLSRGSLHRRSAKRRWLQRDR